MSQVAWTLRRDNPRTFERPLGRNELGFYWDSQFNGTADTLQTAIVENLGPPDHDQSLLSVRNVFDTWRALKLRFPLLGSQLEMRKGGDQVSFTVAEDRLEQIGPDEIYFQSVASLAEAQAYIDGMVNGERLLSDDLLARVVILFQSDQTNQVHLLIHVAHLITDGLGNATILRSFLDILSSLSKDERLDLEERLALALPSDVLATGIRTNQARFRWHRAMGHVISALRSAKINGGHTLPRKFTNLTQYTPARSAQLSMSFSSKRSISILENCRTHGITLGNALPVLAQVALARVLCRQYLRGEMSKEEWEFRKREPTVTGGPLNLRPFLDQKWYREGGSVNVSLVIGFFRYRLPFMPLGHATNLVPGDELPGLEKFLSLPRFLLRSRLIKKQAKALFEHPLFTFIAGARSTASVATLREVGESWRDKQNEIVTPVPVTEQRQVYAHGGSSIGDIDSLLPRHYPLARDGVDFAPRLVLHNAGTKLHCRPAELYLGASTSQKKLHITVYSDLNVYDAETVKEWLNEIRGGMEVFLNQPTKTRL